MSGPRVTHELDQFRALMGDLAPVLASVRDRLQEEGYRREEAVEGSFRVLEVLVEEAQASGGRQ